MSRAVWSSLALASVVGVLAGCGADFETASSDDAIGVASEELKGCQQYNGFTAALGEATLACLGTISPNAYAVDKLTGQLTRRFEKCADIPVDPNNEKRNALQDIDDLLSLQAPDHAQDLPRLGYCMAGQWSEWRSAFIAAGNTTCPAYRKVKTVGLASEEVIKKLAAEQPQLPDYDPQLPDDKQGAEVENPEKQFIGKTSAYYKVGFALGRNPNRGCKDALSCAQTCGAAFPGFTLPPESGYFVGDPTWWLGDEYPPGANPYLVAGYYHPMSFEAPLPGAIYGHRNRVGEKCSKYAGLSLHYKLTLLEYCLDADAGTGCMAKCVRPAALAY